MPFEKGQITNPMGRPRGSSYKTEIWMKQVMPRRMELSQHVVDLAMAGNEKCLLFLADRLFPKPNDLSVNFELPENVKEEDLFKLGEEIIRLIGSGAIPPDQGQMIAGIIKNHRDGLLLKNLMDQVKGLNDKVEKMSK